MDIVIFILVAGISALLGWYFAKFKFTSQQGVPSEEVENIRNLLSQATAEKQSTELRVSDLKQDIIILNEKLDNGNEKLRESEIKLEGAKQKNDFLEQKLLEEKDEIEKIQKKFVAEFENLATRIFDEKSSKFTEQNKTNLDVLLKPLGDKIKDFERKVEDTYEKEARDRTSLGGEIKKLFDLNQQISKEAQNLTNALKGQAKTQGNWGEIILEKILETSGLVKDREYFLQKSFNTTEGRFQPDVIIKYPGSRDIIIDSKVSLNAYDRFVNSEIKEEQDRALKEHILSVRKHIDELSSKNYQDLKDLNTLDFVMLFIPIEPAYLAAMQGDTNLWTIAYEKRILLISPTNMIAILKMTEKLWQQEYQNQNARDIAEKAGSLYDKFVGFIEDLQNIGRKLDDSKSSYENAMNKLSEGKGNIISRAEKLKELGAKTKKTIPQGLLNTANDNEE